MARDFHSQTTLRDLLRTVFRHRWKASAVFLGVMAVVILATSWTPKAYRSEGQLLVRLGRENVTLDPTATLGGSTIVPLPSSRESEINSVVEILKSRVLAEQVVDAIGPDALLSADRGPSGRAIVAAEDAGGWLKRTGEQAQGLVAAAADWLKRLLLITPVSLREQAVLKVSKNLSVDAVTKSNVVRISYAGPTPELSQAVVTTLIDRYLDEHVRINRARGSHEFFIEQTGLLQSQLAEKEVELRNLKVETGLVSPARQRDVLVERLSSLREQLAQVEAEKAAAGKGIAALRGELEALPETQIAARTTGVGNQGTEGMREQLYLLQMQEQEAAARYTESHPKLRLIREQVNRAQEILNEETPTRTHITSGPHRMHEQVQQTLLTEIPRWEALEAKSAELAAQVAAARGELQRLGEDELRVARLQREVELLDANYRKYAVNLEQARIDGQLEAQRMSNINVAQAATYEPKPIRPRTLVNLAIGTLLAALASLLVVLLGEYFDHSFQMPEDIEKQLAVPVLASIPRFRHRQLVVDGRS
jgi:uncharacterized protein involved in exopolysaccharide biosynthesis